MHSHFLSVIVELLGQHGIGARQLLDITGLGDLDMNKPLTLSAAQMDSVCTHALALSNDQQFGLRLGSRINIPSQGILGYALMTSSTIGAALKLLVRYNRTILPSIKIELRLEDGKLKILAQAAQLPHELQRFYSDVLYAAIINSGRILIGTRTINFRLELDYEAPYDGELYRQIFGRNIQFNATRRALSFDEENLGVAISMANPVAQDIFRRECDRLSSRDGHRGMVSERVQEVLLQAGSEFPTGAAVAQQLHMSESTLQRRLAKEGSRYQQLLDRVRYRLANEYLVGTTLPVTEIACLLGFSDATNFRRSFKRWSNTTPSVIRIGGVSLPMRRPTRYPKTEL